MRVPTRGLVLGLAAWVAACGGGEERRPSGCTPGAIQACQCADGADGSRTCDDAGLGFGACDCRPVDVSGPDAFVTDLASPDAVVPADVSADPGPADPGSAEASPDPGPTDAPADVDPEPSPDVPVDGVAAPDPIGPTDTHEEPEAPPDACMPTPVSPCQVPFAVPVTSPLRQDYVWVTGTFSAWATTVEAGAVPLALDAGAGTWSVTLTLSAGPYEYKYLVKWPDGEQQWCVLSQAGAFDCGPTAANQSGAAECGVASPCG